MDRLRKRNLMRDEYKDRPLVSIITPSFNQDKYIEYNINSVMNQDYPRLEHIIIDGGSNDDTISIIKRYENSYNLHWISEPDKGQSDAINKGLRLAKGEIIGWINSDDAYLSKYTISKVVRFFKSNEKAKILVGNCAIIDDKNMVKYIYFIPPVINCYVLKRRNVIPQPSTFFRKSIGITYPLDLSLDYAMDYDLWLRICSTVKFYHINEILGCFRIHSSSKSIFRSKNGILENLEIIRKYQPDSKYLTFNKVDVMQYFANFLPWNLIKIYRFGDRGDFAFDILIPNKKELFKGTFRLAFWINALISRRLY